MMFDHDVTHVSLDATALLALQLDCPARAVVTEALGRSTIWSASALALAEAVAAARRMTDEPTIANEMENGLRRTWDHLHVVPIDQHCLDGAAELAAAQPVSVSTAIHLVAARRIAPDGLYVTFDPAHIPVALSLGLQIASG